MLKNKRFVKIIGYKCEKCGVRKNLTIHHKDKNKKNNIRSNLKCLCRKCHDQIHGIIIKKSKQHKKYQRGTKKWKKRKKK